MRAALRRWATRSLVAAGGALAGAAVVVSAGSSDDRLVWIGAGAVIVAGAAGVLAFAGVLPRPGVGMWGAAFVGLLGAFVIWQGISIIWSIEGDRSWDYFNRGVVYFAFLAVGVFLGAWARWAPVLVAGGLAAVFAAATGWALAVKVFPTLDSDEGRVARLHAPLGYWNTLALLFDMAIPLALWLAARRENRIWLRAAATVFLYALVVALLLTYSRGGLLTALVAVGVWVVVARPRLESVAALSVAVPPGVLLAVWAFGRDGLSKDRQPYEVRVDDGTRFGLLFLVGALVVFVVAWWLGRVEFGEARRRALGRAGWIGLGVAGAAIVIGLVVTAKPQEWFHDFTREANPAVAAGPGRLATVSSNSRWGWWKEAWQAFEDQPVRGTGAGSFELTHHILRKNRLFVTEPHNLALQFLSETGIIGFLLFVGVVAGAAAVAVEAVRRLEGVDQSAALALAVAALAYLVHALLDFDWDFVAVTGPLFLALGVLVSAGRQERADGGGGSLVFAAAVGGVALVALSSLLVPWLSGKTVDDAYAALDRGSARAALHDAQRAHDLNPLAIEPLLASAAAHDALGDLNGARNDYTKAIELQPLNWRPWYELGAFEFARGRPRDALPYLDRAVHLDPYGTQAKNLRDRIVSG
jgi:tetratricopeptide (TPR) repeat protein